MGPCFRRDDQEDNFLHTLEDGRKRPYASSTGYGEMPGWRSRISLPLNPGYGAATRGGAICRG